MSLNFSAIAQRADELIDSGDLDALVKQMTPLEADRFYKALSVICQANTRQSREQACMEIRHILLKAASILAEKQLREEERVAVEAEVIAQLESRYEAWA